jgi:PKD domain
VRNQLIGAIGICIALALPATAVGNPTWQAPSALSQPGSEVVYVDAAMGASGGAAEAWRRSDGTYERIQVSVRQPFGSFAPAVNVTPEKQDGEFPAVAADAAGDATVVWSNVTSSPVTVEAANIVAGLPSTPLPLSPGLHDDLFPSIAENERGDTIVAWQGGDGKNEVIEAAFRPAGGSFGKPVVLSETAENALEAQVAIDAAGDATVVWERSDGKETLVEAALRAAGGNFGKAQPLSEAGESAELPRVAMNAEGDTAVGWVRYDGSHQIAQAVTRTAGSPNFGVVAKEISASGSSASFPDIAIDGRGDPTLVWERENQVEVASATPAGVFGTPMTLGFPGLFPSVAEDSAGDTLVGYLDGARTTASASYRPAGGLFTAPQAVSPPGQAVTPDPAEDDLGMNVAIDGQGDGVFGYRSLNGDYIAGASLLDAAGPLLNGLSIPSDAATGTPTTFSVSPTDQITSVASTTWSFGDGTTASGASVTHAFASPGTYSVSVTSTDASGNSTTQSGKITIATPTSLPLILPFEPASLGSSTVTADTHGHVRLAVGCPAGAAPCRGTVTLTLSATASGLAVSARAKPKGIAVTVPAGHAAFNIAPGAHGSVSIALPAAVAKLLAKRHSLKLTVDVESITSASQSVSKSSTLLVKAPKPKRKKKKSGR